MMEKLREIYGIFDLGAEIVLTDEGIDITGYDDVEGRPLCRMERMYNANWERREDGTYEDTITPLIEKIKHENGSRLTPLA